MLEDRIVSSWKFNEIIQKSSNHAEQWKSRRTRSQRALIALDIIHNFNDFHKPQLDLESTIIKKNLFGAVFLNLIVGIFD